MSCKNCIYGPESISCKIPVMDYFSATRVVDNRNDGKNCLSFSTVSKPKNL